MTKRKQLYPRKRDLKPGSVHKIFTDYREMEDLEGRAKLIEYAPSTYLDELEFIKGSRKTTERTLDLIWSYQRWIIEFIDGPRKGFRTARYISYFKRFSSE